MAAEAALFGLPSRPQRRRGRPARLDREKILAASARLLADSAPEDFTIARLATALGISAMALYTYFPSRDALLDAVAESSFALFAQPAPTARWQDQVDAWLRALESHFGTYPITLKLLGWDGRVSSAWVRTWLPIARLLEREGLSGDRLVFAMSWFLHAAVGTMIAYRPNGNYPTAAAFAALDGLAPDERAFATAYGQAIGRLDRSQGVAFAFGRIVAGLETLMADNKDDE